MKDQDGLNNIVPQLAERVTTQMPYGGKGGGATNNFEKMGRKQENNFLSFSRNIFPIKMFLFFYFSFFSIG